MLEAASSPDDCRWLPGARLNVAESALCARAPDAPGLLWGEEAAPAVRLQEGPSALLPLPGSMCAGTRVPVPESAAHPSCSLNGCSRGARLCRRDSATVCPLHACAQALHSMSLGELRRACCHFAACLRAAGYRPGKTPLVPLGTPSDAHMHTSCDELLLDGIA